jgi:hypothetical protein
MFVGDEDNCGTDGGPRGVVFALEYEAENEGMESVEEIGGRGGIGGGGVRGLNISGPLLSRLDVPDCSS